MNRPSRALPLLLGLGLLVAACGGETADPSAPEEVDPEEVEDVEEIEVDIDDDSLVIYGALHEEEIARLAAAFEQATGIDTEFIRGSAGELAARIQAEGDNPRGDIVLGGPSEIHEALVPEMLRPYESPVAIEEYDAEFYHSEHYWHGFYVGALGLAINTERWEDEFGDREYPSTWDDLLDDDYEGSLAIALPASSGTAYNFLVTQVFRLGEDETWDWFEDFNNTVGQYTTSGAAPARMAAAGEFLMGMTFGHDVLKPIDAGFPLELVYPEETGFEIGAVSIIEGGPNPQAAEVFVDWMLGQEANQLHTDLSMRVPLREDVALPEAATDVNELSLVEGFDAEWAGEERDRLLDEWEERIGG
ncbi:ABC transporter substrate-binding protein [Phytoactinopolyspora mesophila]|uniref:Extracellular solute-binding protein n=1 Tax=Phytoactinopolyspora mesophila TaxID=2650750 RepID=A0A7K3MA27_9ACTN|nr:ABC transporter substrate-binding protein [Phytoactinopolyspora mesophila]NDL60175.1 extracellular solute-binding protein [Phytoactinopolyspora mesophila]